MYTKNNTQRLNIYLSIASFLLVLFVAGILAPIGIDFHHDGFVYKPAEDLLNGKTGFRDTFILHGYLTTWFHSWCLYIMGPSLVMIRFSAVLFYALGAGLLYYVWRKFLPAWLTFVSIFLYLGLMPIWIGPGLFPWSSVYIIPMYAIILLCGYSLLENLENQRYASGMAFLMAICSLILWQFREPPGIFNFLCIALFWPTAALARMMHWKDALRYFGIFVGVSLLGIALWFVYLAADGALTDWYCMTKSDAIRVHVRGFGGKPGFLGTLTHIYNCLIVNQKIPFAIMEPFWILFPLAGGGYVLRAFLPCKECAETPASGSEIGKTQNVKPHLLLMALVLCGSCMQYYPVCCFVHCYWGAAIGIGLVVYAIWCATGKSCNRLSTLACLVVLAFLFFKPIGIWRVPEGIHRLTVAYQQEPMRFSPVFMGIHPSEYDDVKLLPIYWASSLYLQKFPDSEATAMVQSPTQWYLLPKSTCPSKYFTFDRELKTYHPEEYDKLTAFLREKRPLVLLDDVFESDFLKIVSDYEIIYTSEKVTMTKAPLVLMAPKERAEVILKDPAWKSKKPNDVEQDVK